MEKVDLYHDTALSLRESVYFLNEAKEAA